MESALLALLALPLMGVVIYVQRQIPRFTKPGMRVGLTRLLLALVGIGFGLIGAAEMREGFPQLAAFLIGFGVVHIPAALILFIKRKRGEGRT